jgi:hypothetical protein
MKRQQATCPTEARIITHALLDENSQNGRTYLHLLGMVHGQGVISPHPKG